VGLICASLNAGSTEQALAGMTRARELKADMVELRLDLMQSPDLPRLLSDRPLPVIVTNRREDQGGRCTDGESQRLAPLSEALKLGAEFVDVELGSEKGLQRSGNGRVIISHHDFTDCFSTEKLQSLSQQMLAAGADVIKIAATPEHPLDCVPLYDLCRNSAKPVIAIAMGEFGAASRLLALKFGALLSFGSLSTDESTAPGQLTVSEMAETYRAAEISADTRLFAVLGDPIGHSLSPVIHNRAYRQMGLDGLYLSFRVKDRFEEFIRAYAELGFEGFSVTIPHKSAALAAADDVDETAARIGAANTLSLVEGRMRASNTDARACVSQLQNALQERGGLEDKLVLLLGAGGAARAAGWGLVQAGARVIVANRTLERGQKLARELGCEFLPLSQVAKVEYDAALNTTSLGMSPDVQGSALPAAAIRPGAVIYDTVYNPLVTRMLREASEKGARTVDGIGMFVAQAAEQIRIWTARPAPLTEMRQAALSRLKENTCG
jgi:3-dehydroquinate dehydratase / shikimate dehydrogenase